MVNRMLHPQEIEVFYILPALRKYLAKYLKERGLKQKDIAELLQIESATVSQYVSEKRANKINFDEQVLLEIKQATAQLTDKVSMMREMQRLLQIVRKTNTLCKIHRLLSNLPDSCNPTAVGCNVGGELESKTRICN